MFKILLKNLKFIHNIISHYIISNTDPVLRPEFVDGVSPHRFGQQHGLFKLIT